ncbi:MAG: I78 family peptidase inhibitor [Pseudomonadota bacterium]
MTVRTLLAAAILGITLGGCTIPIKLPNSDGCRADGAQGYVGQRYTPRIAKIVKDKAQARLVRAVLPGMMVTQEFRANRVNLTIDDANTVARIYCG